MSSATMMLPRPNPRSLAAAAAAFLAALALFALVNRSRPPAPTSGAREAGSALGSPRSTDAAIRGLQARAGRNPSDPGAWASLGSAYLQKIRETGDSGFYARAEEAFRRALAIDPADAAATVGLGTLALARHDFRAGLRLGMAARRLEPAAVAPYGVIADAQVELGRYEQARRTLQRMVDLKPGLASYSRVAYFRELHGDLGGALEALRIAASSGARGENGAFVWALIGGLELERGHLGPAAAAYRRAAGEFPGYPAARAGLARVAAARGDLGAAIRGQREVVARLPLPEHVIALAETELAAGRRAAARGDLALVRVEARLQRASGMNTDAEIALFEANHGNAIRAVRLGRRAWRAAPSVRSADALGWALTRAGFPRAGLRYARRALSLGSRDPLFRYHAGVSARAAGRRGEARVHLRRALSPNPRFSPLYAPRARRALEALR